MYIVIAKMSTEHTDNVKKLTDIGFEKVCILNPSYQTLAASAQDAVASAWNDSENKMVNENQEIADDWSAKSTIAFFKHKFNAVQKSKNHIVAAKGKDVLVGKKYAKCMIIASGKTKGVGAKKGAEGAFASAPDAYNKACKALFDDLDEDED